MRQGLVGIVTVCALALAPTAAMAQADGDESASGGGSSLAARLLTVADTSLGEDATIAVLRAFDRGYEVLQVVEAMFEGLLAPDGTIADEDGAVTEPNLSPSNLIEGDGASTGSIASGFSGGAGGSAEQIAVRALEAGVARTTKKIDKQVDLEARADRADVSSADLFTMLTVIALRAKGYSMEQILVDGFAAEGIELDGIGFIPVIVDEKGKVLRPDGVEASPDTEEQAGSIDQLESDIVDLVGGVDPATAAGEAITKEFTVKLEITVGVDDDAPFGIAATGKLGDPKSGSDQFEGWVLGTAGGHVDGDGRCTIGDFVDESVGWTITGPVDLGIAGRVDGKTASVKAGVVRSILDVSVENEDTICGDLILDTAEAAVSAVTVGPFDLKLEKGATADASGTVLGTRYEATISLS